MTTGNLDYDRVTDAIIILARAVHYLDDGSSNPDDDHDRLWCIGEGGECDLADFIVGAYWHYTEWHDGQYSPTYAALCSLGTVFQPGMSSVESDNEAYIALNSLASL